VKVGIFDPVVGRVASIAEGCNPEKNFNSNSMESGTVEGKRLTREAGSTIGPVEVRVIQSLNDLT
jgi:hypothetical protein